MTKFSAWEQVNLAVLLAFLFVPATLLIEITITHKLGALPVLINVIIAALLARLFIYRYLPISSIKLSNLITSPLLYIFFLQLIVVIVIFSAYLALPDVDPYHWIKSYNQNFIDSSLAELPQRPLFHTFIYTLDQIPYLKTEVIFKYIIPLLSLTSLLPIWLVARRYRSKPQQTLLLLTPLLSPSLIIHTQMGTPQAILIILTIFFVFFLIYSHLTNKKLWHYLAGLIMLLAVPLHGLALLMFASWLAATAWHHPKRHYILLLLLPIAILITPYLLAYLPQVFSDVRPNLTFPTTFTTIDGVQNSWPGVQGLAQYYAFYLGLIVPVILISNIYFFLKRSAYRRQISQLTNSNSTLTLVFMFIGFFFIAEVLPRLFNVVILPDRAWLFASLAATVFLIPLFNLKFKRQKLIYTSLFLLFAINLGGALYINNLKKHSLPDYLVTSARWIDNNLSANTTVFFNSSTDYIDLYTSVNFVSVPQDFFCHSPSIPANQNNTSYILFLKPDPLHPYANRPWYKPPDTKCIQPSLNKYPDRFQQIYNDANQAIIWKIL